MLKRSIADRKMEALVKGRDKFLGHGKRLAAGDVDAARSRDRRADLQVTESSVHQSSDLFSAELVSAGWIGNDLHVLPHRDRRSCSKPRCRTARFDSSPTARRFIRSRRRFSARRIYFVRGGSVWRIDRDTLVEAEVVRLRECATGECSLSADGEWMTAAIKQGAQAGIVTGRADGTDWRLIPFDRTVIHPQFHPLEPEWMIFAGDPAPRMFRVRRDGSGMECLYEHGNDEFIVHETFLGRTGDIVFTVWPRRCAAWIGPRANSRDRALQRLAHRSNSAGTQVLCDTNHPGPWASS